MTNIILVALLTIVILSLLIISIIKAVNKDDKELATAMISDVILEEEKKEVTPEVKKEANVEETKKVKETKLSYRLTSYYTGDGTGSGSVTASGKSTKDFQINERGWYTYQGKLVVATASKRLLSWEKYKDSTQRFFNLYDELILEIDGVRYDAIVLDVCGAAMKKPIIDLFVSAPYAVKDTYIKVIIKN